MTDLSINQRTQQVLRTLVDRYIQEGTPIGSKTLADSSMLGLSPATIRNILADLENAGYLTSPHPSAGRIPTALGYRFFVNCLLTVRPLENTEVKVMQQSLDPDLAMGDLLHSASFLLSSLTQQTAVVALPKQNRVKLRQVEFLALSQNRVLVILVLDSQEVQNRIIYTDKIYTQSELQQAANFLNQHYAGKGLLTIRKALRIIIEEEGRTLAELSGLVKTTMDVGSKVFNAGAEQGRDCIIAGQNNLLSRTNKEVDIEKLRILFDKLTEKKQILSLLDQALQAEGIQIFIGEESGYEGFDECSIITTSYAVDGKFLGSLGVIGPTRMPYERVISAVDITAKLLSAALNQR